MELRMDSSFLLSSLPFDIAILVDEKGRALDFNSNLMGLKMKPSYILKKVDANKYLRGRTASTEKCISLFKRNFNMFFIPLYLSGEKTLYLFLFKDCSRSAQLDNMRSMFMWFILNRIKYPILDIRRDLNSVKSDERFQLNEKLISMVHDISKKLFELHSYSENVYYLFAIDTGIIKNIYKEEEFNVLALVKDVVKAVSEVYEDKHIDVEIISDNEVYYKVDREIMKRILENIVGNAFLYSFDNGKIEIELKKTKEELFLAVTDEGRGMNEAKLQEILALFESREYMEVKGTLGLRVTRSLVDFLNGTMIVESEEGKGTRVSIHFYRD